MTNSIYILGIETSCDETAVAIIKKDDPIESRIRSNLLFSQIDQHQLYGGVVPELAARAHLEKLAPLVESALKKANLSANDISAVAATCGPGLIGGVVVGAMYAKALAATLKKPFIPVNHLEGHALTIRLTHDLPFPYLLLLASGGHCQFLEVRGLGDYHLLGQTIDDAVGEAFDKVASMLDFPYPGGPHIEKQALSGNQKAFDFPRPLFKKPGCDFSFSGLKTAVKNTLQDCKNSDLNNKSPSTVDDIAASFQAAVIDCITDRTQNAIKMLKSPIPSLVIAGGVAANKAIYNALCAIATEHHMKAYAPPLKLCTDNAAMIAWVGAERLSMYTDCKKSLNFEPRPRWPLMEIS